MPATKDQIKRIEVLDELLSQHKWTLDELLSRLNGKLFDSPINKRTLYRDLDYLEGEKRAPLHRSEKGDNLYYYAEKFSLKNMPLDEDDVAILRKAIDILKQVDNFEVLGDVETVIAKLENKIHVQSSVSNAVVQFEKHTTSLGHDHLNELFDAITSKCPLRISYQPYFGKPELECIVYPYLLREYRNRWFLFGRQGNSSKGISVYALDRIKKLKPSDQTYIENDLFDAEVYFQHLIGVSVPSGAQPEVIEIKVMPEQVPYIKSKPIHHNQEEGKPFKDGSQLFQLKLIINYELKSTLLSYGSGIEVRKPDALREEMRKAVKAMNERYD